jgi:hypothetical protein
MDPPSLRGILKPKRLSHRLRKLARRQKSKKTEIEEQAEEEKPEQPSDRSRRRKSTKKKHGFQTAKFTRLSERR